MRSPELAAKITFSPSPGPLLARTRAFFDRAPSLSPDGSLISYSSRNSSRYYQLYVMNADGSNPYLVFPTIEDQDVFNQCWLNQTT